MALRLAAIEAEVVLGPRVRELVAGLDSVAQRLRGAINAEICRQEDPKTYAGMTVDNLHQMRNLAFGVPLIDGGDLLKEELGVAVAAMDSYARPHIYASVHGAPGPLDAASDRP